MQVISRFQNLALWFNTHTFVVTMPFALVVFVVLFLSSTSNTCAQGNCPVGTHGECTLLPSGKIKCYCEGNDNGGGSSQTHLRQAEVAIKQSMPQWVRRVFICRADRRDLEI